MDKDRFSFERKWGRWSFEAYFIPESVRAGRAEEFAQWCFERGLWPTPENEYGTVRLRGTTWRTSRIVEMKLFWV